MSVSSRVTRAGLAVALSASMAGAFACSKDTPTSPDKPVAQAPSPQPTQPGPAPAPGPVAGAVEISINPNPVPHSGTPITDAAGCKDVKYTWFYDQVFRETGGSTVTLLSSICTEPAMVSAEAANSRSKACSAARWA